MDNLCKRLSDKTAIAMQELREMTAKGEQDCGLHHVTHSLGMKYGCLVPTPLL